MTSLDIESIQALDFDFVPPCEVTPTERWPYCGNNNPADYRVVLVDCCPERGGRVLLFCSPCMEEKLSATTLLCPGCGEAFRPPMTSYKSVTKIRD